MFVHGVVMERVNGGWLCPICVESYGKSDLWLDFRQWLIHTEVGLYDIDEEINPADLLGPR
jgi:hypothetical protein